MKPTRLKFVLPIFVILIWLTLASCSSPSQKVTYQLSGSAQTAVVAYRNAEGQLTQETVKLPWQMQLEVGESFSYAFYAFNPAPTGKVTCKVLTTARALGQATGKKYVSCTGDVISQGGTSSGLFTGSQDKYPEGSSLPREKLTGELVLFSYSAPKDDPELYLLDLQTQKRAPLTEGLAGGYSLALSPTEPKILFKIRRNNQDDLYLMDLSGGQAHAPVQITHSPEAENCPSWSPDGKQIIFDQLSKDASNPRYLVTLNASDGSQVSALPWPNSVTKHSIACPTWTPDGKQLTVISNQDGYSALYRMELDGTKLTPITQATDGEITDYAWSPDGQTLLVIYDGKNLVLMKPDGTLVKSLLSTEREIEAPRWDALGSKLLLSGIPAAQEPQAYYSSLFLLPLDSLEPEVLLKIKSTYLGDPLFLPEGLFSGLPAEPFQVTLP